MLLTVVITLAIVCLIFYHLAQLSLGYVQQTAERERSIRERWTVVTLRRALLQQTPAVFARREQAVNLATTSSEPASSAGGAANSQTRAIYFNELEDRLQINKLQVAIRARDENARVSVPGLLRAKPRAEVQTMIERLQGSRGLALKNFPIASQQFEPKAWRELFQWQPDDGTAQLVRATERLTLWGSGRLNIYRADDETIEETWRSLFGHFPPREFVELRMRYPPLAWQQLRERLDLRDAQAALADAWFSSTSDCFSVRLALQSTGAVGNLSKRYYFVLDRGSYHFGFEE